MTNNRSDTIQIKVQLFACDYRMGVLRSHRRHCSHVFQCHFLGSSRTFHIERQSSGPHSRREKGHLSSVSGYMLLPLHLLFQGSSNLSKYSHKQFQLIDWFIAFFTVVFLMYVLLCLIWLTNSNQHWFFLNTCTDSFNKIHTLSVSKSTLLYWFLSTRSL